MPKRLVIACRPPRMTFIVVKRNAVKKVLMEAKSVHGLVYDLISADGESREHLISFAAPAFNLSPTIKVP